MLKGNLILLRAIEESDLETIQAWNFDEDTTRFFSPRLPNNMLEQRKWFESQINRADKKKLMIVDASTETPIGLLGLMNIDHVNKNCEIGITIDNNYRGKPHSLDAMQTALHFLFYEFSMQLVYLTVFAENKRAISFFEKLGFSNSGTLRQMVYKAGKYHDILWMSVTREEFCK